METKQKKGRGKYWTHKWNFENFCEVERVGLSGELLLCWKNISLNVLDATKNFIHTRMKHPTFGLCYFTFVYGHPKTSKRKEVWDQLASFQEHINGPWIWIGDFNQVLSNEDKQSSTSQNCPRASHLHNCLRDTEMRPLQSTRVKYTWKNKRDGDALVLEKLDRAFY